LSKQPYKFLAAGDLHYGYERKGINSKLVPLHNQRCIDGLIEFAHDYKPDKFLLMGDGIDCGPISHWNRSRRRSVEGLRLQEDVEEFKTRFFNPINQALPAHCKKVYLEGNHEYWIRQVLEDYPGLDGLIDLPSLLKLDKHGWDWLKMGSVIREGKWLGIHGENMPNSEMVAKKAVTDYECNIRLWHNHTFQVFTKRTAVDLSEVKNGISVPGLCDRAPGYGKKAPNRHCHGFLTCEVFGNGFFTDQVTLITEAGFRLFGKTYAARSNRKFIVLPGGKKAA
jgi:hypothetical protein